LAFQAAVEAELEKLIAAVQAMEPEMLMYAQHELTEHMKHAFAELGQYVESARMEFLDAPSGKLFQVMLRRTESRLFYAIG
jgi:hypothetical protein